MEPTENALLAHFIKTYEQGHILKALQSIVSRPRVSYDDLSQKGSPLWYLINYVDASIFKGIFETYVTNRALQKVLQSDARLTEFASTFLQILHWEEVILQNYMSAELSEETIVDEEKLADFLQFIPPFYLASLRKKSAVFANWQSSKNAKPQLAQMIDENKEIKWHLPWYSFSYNLPCNKAVKLEKNELPFIFLELLEDADYEKFLEPYQHQQIIDQQIIFVFETKAHFLQFFQFPKLASILSNPRHFIYILELYPQDLLNAQNGLKKRSEPFSLHLVSMAEGFPEAELLPVKAAFEEWLAGKDSSLTYKLYSVCKNVLFKKQVLRYGKSRLIPLNINESDGRLFDPHKGPISIEEQLKEAQRIYEELIQPKGENRIIQARTPKKELLVAHVTSQIVDGGHAPTRLLRHLLTLANKDKFKNVIISTEGMCIRPGEYPLINYSTPSSSLRGRETIESFRELGVEVFVEGASLTYDQTIGKTLELLHQLNADIVVFHGPDEMNSITGYYTDVPVRILFEHGALPPYPSFDAVILSSEEAYKKWHEIFLQQGMKSTVLPFCADSKSGWQKEAFSKKELGLPEDSFIMTTISHHLDTRLTQEMCEAIGEILKRSPHAYYAPIGRIVHPEKILSLLQPYGVTDRVIFLGQLPFPSQYARSMNLYLNEFPIGSGLGLLDAMAAGCPVVSMYDPNGPQAATYGGVYFGIERTIKTGKKQDYVELACRLIQNPILYREWSEHALKQYAKHSDIKAYVQTFEEILLKFS